MNQFLNRSALEYVRIESYGLKSITDGCVCGFYPQSKEEADNAERFYERSVDECYGYEHMNIQLYM